MPRLDMLKRTVALIERRRPHGPPPSSPLGHAGIDAALGGGLMRGRLHEIFAAEPGDTSSAAGFAAMLARRLGGGIVWLRQEDAEKRGGRLHPPGLAAIGIDPSRLILGVLPDPQTLLRAAAEVVRCPEVGVAMIEVWRMPRMLDPTANRRLALAAEASGVTALLLRIEAEAAPSAAWTRWAVAAAASAPLDAGAPGHPALDITLSRQRGRPAGGRWEVEWDHDRACFDDRRTGDRQAGDRRTGGWPGDGAASPGPVLPRIADRQAEPLRHSA